MPWMYTLFCYHISLLQSRNETRTYQLIPVNDTELLSVLNEMPLELDQLRILCDVVAMEESMKMINPAYHYNSSAIISEQVRLKLLNCML